MEEEMNMAETEQGDTVSNDGETSVEMPNAKSVKRGRGRPQGSKKLKVCVTNVNLTELVSPSSNGASTQPRRKRGRPRLSDTKHTQQQGSDADNSVQTHRGRGRPKGSKNRAINEDSTLTEHSPKKKGSSNKPLSESTVEKAAAEDLPNGGSDTPKRGRPRGSTKRKADSLPSEEEDRGSSVTPRKRGRPKGSLNKKPMLEREVSSEGDAETDGSPNTRRRGRGRLRKVAVNYTGGFTQDTSNGISKTSRRGRGRPRKNIEQKSGDSVTGGSPPAKRGRGRPKGSLNKKPPAYKMHGKVGRPRRVDAVPAKGRKRGRPRQQPAKRGRPRKYPLPSPEELKKPKVWKPLGRPRKYPRVDPPEGAPPAPRRSRGRPRKSESKKGAHLRKSFSATPSTQHNPSDGHPRKRGRPPSAAKSKDDTPRKRGRPKGSVNKNKVRSETQPDDTVPNHSKAKSNSPAVGVESETEPVEQEVDHNTETIPIKHGDDTEETLINQDVSFDLRDQA